MRCLVIADDFTGANDTGVQLFKKGASVGVSLNWQDSTTPQSDVLVINTESRAIDSKEAFSRVATCIDNIYAQSPDLLIYKKIDSTFRGNVGAEIEAAVKATNIPLVIVAGAIPQAGRTTVNGVCLVDGVPLLETEFAKDPKTPIFSSRIEAIIERQTTIKIEEINLETLYSDGFVATIEAKPIEPLIVVVDAKTDEDLMVLGKKLNHFKRRFILVGAAGLANALPRNLLTEKKSTLPTLIVAGSMSINTQKQVLYAKEQLDLTIIDIDVSRILHKEKDYAKEILNDAIYALQQGSHCALRTLKSDHDRDDVEKLCEQFNLSRQEVGSCIGQWIGAVAKDILDQQKISGLFLTGGDMAIAVAEAVQAQGYRIKGEVMPCIPYGNFVNTKTLQSNQLSELNVITKAGGFGDQTTIMTAVNFLMENQ